MLRLRRKRQETLARLKKISKESQEISPKNGIEGSRYRSNSIKFAISEKEVFQYGSNSIKFATLGKYFLYEEQENLTDSGNIQETKNNKTTIPNYHTLQELLTWTLAKMLCILQKRTTKLTTRQ